MVLNTFNIVTIRLKKRKKNVEKSSGWIENEKKKDFLLSENIIIL